GDATSTVTTAPAPSGASGSVSTAEPRRPWSRATCLRSPRSASTVAASSTRSPSVGRCTNFVSAEASNPGMQDGITLRLASALAVILVVGVVLAGCGGGGGPTGGVAGVHKTVAASGQDWTRFGWDARRSSDDPHPTGITAANVSSLVRQQVHLPGTVDSS